MEEKPVHPVVDCHDALCISRCFRDVPPAHYTLKINNFSKINTVDKFETGNFEAGGYTWKLILYPNGDKERNGSGHISMYLAISETNTLPLGWEINVNIKFFMFDQIQDKYLTIQDAEGRLRRFHEMKTQWGFSHLLPLSIFNDASNGYLINDSCVFGVELFVVKYSGNGECLSVMEKFSNHTFTWKIDKFSATDEECHSSDLFSMGQGKWKLRLYPKGCSTGKGNSLSLFLELLDWETLALKRKLYAEFVLRIVDQVHNNHYERKTEKWFYPPVADWGFPKFMPLTDLTDSSKGFELNDTLVVEVEFIFMSFIKDL